MRGWGGPASARRPFAVAAVKRFHHGHAERDLAKRREALTIEAVIVLVVDENLGRACVGTAGREGDEALLVALGDRVVLDVRVLPLRLNQRGSVDSKLNHGARDDAENTVVIV